MSWSDLVEDVRQTIRMQLMLANIEDGYALALTCRGEWDRPPTTFAVWQSATRPYKQPMRDTEAALLPMWPRPGTPVYCPSADCVGVVMECEAPPPRPMHQIRPFRVNGGLVTILPFIWFGIPHFFPLVEINAIGDRFLRPLGRLRVLARIVKDEAARRDIPYVDAPFDYSEYDA